MEKHPSHAHRNVLIYVALANDEFPPASNTHEDVALLRAANLALRRKALGISDVFLFLVVGTELSDAANAALLAYGFPDAEIALVDAPFPEDALGVSSDSHEGVDAAIRNWLTANHPEAIGFAAGLYGNDTFWWIGIENSEPAADRLTWPFSIDAFASELPQSHLGKAATWLSVLASATKQIAMHDDVCEQRACVAAATLCEWLHGFEAASGNGYNDFDGTSTIAGLQISPLFLGFEAARLSSEPLELLCEAHDVAIDGLEAVTLGLITRSLRDALREALSDFFGGDAWLFWTLHSTIWPAFRQPMQVELEALVNDASFDVIAEHSEPWTFVSEGWCEAAD